MAVKNNLERRAARKKAIEQNKKVVRTGCGGCAKRRAQRRKDLKS